MIKRITMPRYILCFVFLLASCGDEERFLPLLQVTMTENTPAFAVADDGALYWVEERVIFPIRRPRNAELRDLERGDPATFAPFSRLPWVPSRDMDEELSFTLSNLEDEAVEAGVTFNAISEFFEYIPGFATDGDMVVANFSGWEGHYTLQALERRTITVRREHFREMEVDLATCANGAPNFNQVMQFESQSDVDSRVQMYIPPAIPGLVGLRAGLMSTEPRRLLLEVSTRLVDHNDRLADEDQRPWEIPAPATLMPMVTLP